MSSRSIPARGACPRYPAGPARTQAPSNNAAPHCAQASRLPHFAGSRTAQRPLHLRSTPADSPGRIRSSRGTSGRLLAAAGLALLLSAVAFADTVTLTNGRKLEGKARRAGDRVIIKTPGGELILEASEVRGIEKGRTVADDYLDKSKAVAKDDADAQANLAAWCNEKGLRKEARAHWRAVLVLDADHAEAREALGYRQQDGVWMTADEVKEAAGFVKIGGKWVERTQARRSKRDREQKKAVKEHAKTIRGHVRLMASHKRKTRLKGKVGLQQYAESIGDLRLAAWAGDVAGYYNRAWTVRKTSLMKTEMRVTHAKLKRPIKTFRTSLGGFSTPVTLQLPELSIVSIKTTVMIPATEIELDQDG
jgi:hypothetical protein